MEKQMFLEMEQFIVQGVSGAYMGLYRHDKEVFMTVYKDPRTIHNYFMIYLNMCWHAYHKQDDVYVVKSINSVLKYGKIKGIVCVIHWFNVIGQEIISSMCPSTELETIVKNETDVNIV